MASDAGIHSRDEANHALDAAAADRKQVAARFAEDSRLCQEKFFATSCMDDAKARQRAALKSIREREIAADAYLRQAKAADRDAALQEKARRDETEQAERRAEQPASRTTGAAPEAEDHAPRPAHHAPEKPQPSAAELAADAAKRAENVKAYEEKARKSAERQREVAEKRRQKAREEGKPVPHGPVELPPIEEPNYRIDTMPKLPSQ